MKKAKGLATIGEAVAAKGGARETFGHALTRLMKEGTATRHEIAQRAGVPESMVRRWEGGEETPTRAEYGRVCQVLKKMRGYPPDSFHAPKHAETLPDALAKKIAPLAAFDELGGWSEPGGWPGERGAPPPPAVVVGADGEVMAGIVERAQNVDLDAETEEKLGKIGDSGRTNKVRQVARLFLADAATPEERKMRLEAIRAELPRAERRALGIPSPDAMPSLRPVPRVVGPKKCPRCSLEVNDLVAHRDHCSNRTEKVWEKKGWRTCDKSRHPHHWNVNLVNGWHGAAAIPNPPKEMVLRSAPCEAHRPARVAPRSPAPSEDVDVRKASSEEPPVAVTATDSVSTSVPTAPDSEVRTDGLEMAERCLVLAEALWPGEAYVFTLGADDKTGWRARIERDTESGTDAVIATGVGTEKRAAVRALADALRAETKERARAAEEMARLLED